MDVVFSHDRKKKELIGTVFAVIFLTEGSQRKHAVELPLLGVSDDVSRVVALFGAMEQRPPEVGLTQQAEHTQLPLDLRERNRLMTD